MKQCKSFAAMIIAVSMTTFLFSCGSGDEKKADDATKDTAAVKSADTTATTQAVVTPAKLSDIVIIKHKVANFAKWLPFYEGGDSLRAANDVKSYVIGRGLTDSNMVVVIDKIGDTAKAKAFGMSKALKDVMKKAGVISAPSISMLNVVFNDSSKIDQTERLMVTHKVKDFDAWKKEFDDHKSTRTENGLIDRGVAHNIDDPNSVSIVFAITDMKKAQAFLKSKDLKDKMDKAGVVGAPTFFFYKIAKKY